MKSDLTKVELSWDPLQPKVKQSLVLSLNTAKNNRLNATVRQVVASANGCHTTDPHLSVEEDWEKCWSEKF